STVLKAVAGFLKPQDGSIRLAGEDIGDLRPHRVLERGCAYVAQGQDLFPQMTVLENVEMGGFLIRSRTRRQARRDACLELFPGLKDKAAARAQALSGGERQQLKLARAFMTDPAVLLLDEPSAGLSPLLVEQVFGDLARILRETGVGALLVEQNVSKALEVADKVCVLELGRVVATDAPDVLARSDTIRDLYLGQGPPDPQAQPERPQQTTSEGKAG
ncbi:MAG: ABC transporter ATP-binding protein, partial [Egibacteraceae bacterium]